MRSTNERAESSRSLAMHEQVEARLRADASGARRAAPAELPARIRWSLRAARPERARAYRWAWLPVAAALLVVAALVFTRGGGAAEPSVETTTASLGGKTRLVHDLLRKPLATDRLLCQLTEETFAGEIRGLSTEGARAARIYSQLVPRPLREALLDGSR